MIPIEPTNDPVWHTFHRAWTSCTGRPGYEKRAWLNLDAWAVLASKMYLTASRMQGREGWPPEKIAATLPDVVAFLAEVESLQKKQGGRSKKVSFTVPEAGDYYIEGPGVQPGVRRLEAGDAIDFTVPDTLPARKVES